MLSFPFISYLSHKIKFDAIISPPWVPILWVLYFIWLRISDEDLGWFCTTSYRHQGNHELGVSLFRFPKARNVPIALVFDEGRDWLRPHWGTLMEYSPSQSQGLYGTQKEKITLTHSCWHVWLYTWRRLNAFKLWDLFIVWKQPWPGQCHCMAFDAPPPQAPNTHTHLLLYRTPPVPHLTSPCWGWPAHGRAFNAWHWLSGMWSGKQKGSIQSKTSRRQLERWDWEFPQEVRAGLGRSWEKGQWKTWEHAMSTAETNAHLRMELMLELGVVGPEELRGAGVNPWACMWDTQALVNKQTLCRLLWLPAHARDCYEINWGTLNLWRVYLSKCPFQLGNIKPEVVRRNPPTGAGAKVLENRCRSKAKQFLTGYRA